MLVSARKWCQASLFRPPGQELGENPSFSSNHPFARWWFSTRGDSAFPPRPRSIWRCLEVFWVVTSGGGVASLIWGMEARNAANHPVTCQMDRTTVDYQ